MANISASVNATTGDTLDISVGGGNTFTFTNDNSGVLAAIGLNSFFTGYDARTIGVNQDLVDNPEWLSSGYSLDPLNTGDNQAALDMADVRNGLFLDSNSATINDAYEAAVVAIGIDSRANTQTRDLEEQFVQNFDLRRQEISGVSLDEETVRLIQFQRAYEGNARVISTVNAMLEVLVNLGR